MSGCSNVETAYRLAVEQYARIGVDVDAALRRLRKVTVSVHCWQGDDVRGFEHAASELGGGLAVTGQHPGRARNAEELRSDLEVAYSLIPGSHRLNLHAIYGDFDRPVSRDELGVEHFQSWIDWSTEQGVPLDFNATFFSHPLAADGFTLTHPDRGVRQFWIGHGVACRGIAAAMGQAQQSPCIHNFWVPDGYKETPADRRSPRERLADSLDTIFAKPLPAEHTQESVECKLFGIGSESYVVGSHEFYFGYAITRNKILCLDAGHFHPTEVISDKISSALMYVPELLLHISRGVRWDSDHVVTLNDEVHAILQEVVRADVSARVHLGLDFFDGSINRIAAWVIGTRNVLKAALAALLEPTAELKQLECSGDLTARLALMEELKTMPLSAIWNFHCESSGVPTGIEWLRTVRQYETDVQFKRLPR